MPNCALALVATCSGQDDAQLQEALSAVLAPVQYWPRWAAPPGSPRKGAAGGSHAGWGGEAEEGEGQEDGDDSAGGSLEASFTSHADLASRCKVGAYMCAFVASLCSEVGPETVLAIGPAVESHLARSWLAVELLCQWTWTPKAGANAAFLVVPVLAMAADADTRSPAVAGVLSRCLAGAAASEEADLEWVALEAGEPCGAAETGCREYERALCAALEGLVGAAAGSQQVARAIEHFFRESVAGAEPLRPGASAAVPSQLLTAARPGSIAPSTLRRILQVVAPVLRLEPASQELQRLCARWLSTAAALPQPQLLAPAAAPGSSELARVAGDLRRWCTATRVSLAALPLVKADGGAVAAAGLASAEERAALLQLLRTQAAAHQRAKAAAAAAARSGAHPRQDDGQKRGDLLREVGAMQAEAGTLAAQLMLAVATYAMEDATGDDWALMLVAADRLIGDLTLEAEECVEALAGAASAGAAQLSKAELTPTEAIAVLAQLPNVGAVETAALEALRATHFYASAAGDLSGPQACVELLLLLVCKLGERFGSSLPLPKARPHSPGQTLTCAELRSRSSLPARIPGLRFTRQPLSLRSPWHACLAEPLIYRLCNASAGYRHIYRNALRLLLCWGALEAIASAASSRPPLPGGQRTGRVSPLRALWDMQAGCGGLLRALGQVAHATVAGHTAALEEAIAAANAWAEDTGMGAADSLLALCLSPAPVPDLRHAALRVLHASSLRKCLTSAGALEEEDPDQEDEDEGADARSTEAALVAAGVRPTLARSLGGCDGEDGGGGGGDGALLAWVLFLEHMGQLPFGSAGRQRLAQAVKDAGELVPALLDRLLPMLALPLAKGGKQQQQQAATPSPPESSLAQLRGILAQPAAPRSYASTPLAAGIFASVVRTLPASIRLWFNDLRDSAALAALERYTIQRESPRLIEAEMRGIQEFAAAQSLESFAVKTNPAVREIVAVVEIEDDAKLELVVKLPASFPLRPAEADVREKVGVSEGRLRKWLMSINVFLRNYNGSVGDAIELWRRNVQKEFEGLEECLICYSVIHPANRSLPRLSCRTCTKRFHAACLYKWFRSSGKSNCPHCQSPW
eukprot:jgi/Tetstr1/444160/TSEL_032054.t1